ncbi:MAG: hypothetical protein ACOZQL_34680 [Myxococcota bacterium]
MIKGPNAAQSGLAAASTTLAVSAHNVANTLTRGFEPQKVAPAELAGGGVTVSISREARKLEERTDELPSGTDLVAETGARIGAAAAYRANLKTIEATDDVTGVVVRLTESTEK